MVTALSAEFHGSAATTERLKGLITSLRRWNTAVNLVARGTLTDAWQRHVIDSVQLLDHAPPTARTWADLGSGGGFPGLAVAIAAIEARPELRVILIESDQRKATFLRETARTLGVAVAIKGCRIEDVPPLEADVVSARALAPLSDLWPLARRHLAADGVGLFLKGKGFAAELENARSRWPVAIDELRSRTSPDGVILRVRRGD